MKVNNSEGIDNMGQEEYENVSNLASSLGRLSLHLKDNDLPEVEHSLAKISLHGQDEEDSPQESQNEEEQEDKEPIDLVQHTSPSHEEENDGNKKSEDKVKEVCSDKMSQEESTIKVEEDLSHDEEKDITVPTRDATLRIKTEVSSDSEEEKEEENDEKSEEIKEVVNADEPEVKEKVKDESIEKEEDHSDDENPPDEVKQEKKPSKLRTRGGVEINNYYMYNSGGRQMCESQYQQRIREPDYSLPGPYGANNLINYNCGSVSPQYAQSLDSPPMYPIQGGVTDSDMYGANGSDNYTYGPSSSPTSMQAGTLCVSPQYAQSPDSPSMYPIQGGVTDSDMYGANGSDNYTYGPSLSPTSMQAGTLCVSPQYAQSLDSLSMYPIQGGVTDSDVYGAVNYTSGSDNYTDCSSSPRRQQLTFLDDNGVHTESTELQQVLEVIDKVERENLSYRAPVNKLQIIIQNLTHELCEGEPKWSDNSWKMEFDRQQLLQARKMVASKTNEGVVRKDEDGDTPSMIMACRPVDQDGYTENLMALIERQEDILLCCDEVVNRTTGQCTKCGNSNQDTFYTSLSIKNVQGDSILSSVIKIKHPVSVINYVFKKIESRRSDYIRIFGSPDYKYKNINPILESPDLLFYHKYKNMYPILERVFN
ncbi:histone acetyltransferase KAT6A-like isoform X2 [Homarus americanus]|uniref:histone acetyltransferase KAT6A-like isoform X2 n=1 Tax=Homarus americanus TaxID=6706 RepID=UPI001C4452F6|nr:histone acetyltransferase KAT6A-like isoform X2 [Homarus americanus]